MSAGSLDRNRKWTLVTSFMRSAAYVLKMFACSCSPDSLVMVEKLIINQKQMNMWACESRVPSWRLFLVTWMFAWRQVLLIIWTSAGRPREHFGVKSSPAVSSSSSSTSLALTSCQQTSWLLSVNWFSRNFLPMFLIKSLPAIEDL